MTVLKCSAGILAYLLVMIFLMAYGFPYVVRIIGRLVELAYTTPLPF